MIEVTPKDKESIDRTLARFRRAVHKAGVFTELEKHSYFIKKSQRRKLKRKGGLNPRGTSRKRTTTTTK